MTVGTKSILYGSHAFWLHPWFVAYAWYKLYGFPYDPRLWVSFFVHDLGYIGKPNMDGEEGETHPELGANIMKIFFGKKWSDFVLFHSRFYAKKLNNKPSKLCIADKLAICLTPTWLYVPMAKTTGEIYEYMKEYKKMNPGGRPHGNDMDLWHKEVKRYIGKWVDAHKNGKKDTWTKIRVTN